MTSAHPVTEGFDWNAMPDTDFRVEVRSFIEVNFPATLRHLSRRARWQEIRPWYMALSEKGWLAPNWPREHQGMGLSPAKHLIMVEEQERWGVARPPDLGITMIGPLLIRYGTEEQRRTYLPRILNGEHVWCQGYSEPDAGSDLAALRTEAVPEGESFLINGRKIWTTLAQDATHMFLLARTDREAAKHRGISFLLLDLSSPGITVRPIENLLGVAEFCEVVLDNVRTPSCNLVGGLNEGWRMAMALLGFERILHGSPKQAIHALDQLFRFATSKGLKDDPLFIERFTQLRLDVADLSSLYARFASKVRENRDLGPEVSMLKIWASETFQRVTEFLVETAGPEDLLGPLGDSGVDVAGLFYRARPATIYAGSSEIQRNILAKHVLELPN